MSSETSFRLAVTATLFALVLWLPTAAKADDGAGEAPACGEETPCELPGGEYYIHLPEHPEAGEPLGAIFFLHGHGGKALNAIRNPGFRKMADELGVAFVAVQGVKGTWSFPTAPSHLRNEPAFFDSVMKDVSDRFGVDPQHTMLSGFSSGAFMTWYLACDNSERFAGYATVSGAFWEPLPEACPTKTPYLFHVHGTSDTVVPIEGRWLGGDKWKQGDVFESFDVWLRQEGLAGTKPETYTDDGLKCERWVPKTGMLEICLHPGGHSVEAGWIKRAWMELSKMKGWQHS